MENGLEVTYTKEIFLQEPVQDIQIFPHQCQWRIFWSPTMNRKDSAALQFCCRNIWQLQDVCSTFSASLMIHVQDNQLHLCNQQIDTAIMTP